MTNRRSMQGYAQRVSRALQFQPGHVGGRVASAQPVLRRARIGVAGAITPVSYWWKMDDTAGTALVEESGGPSFVVNPGNTFLANNVDPYDSTYAFQRNIAGGTVIADMSGLSLGAAGTIVLDFFCEFMEPPLDWPETGIDSELTVFAVRNGTAQDVGFEMSLCCEADTGSPHLRFYNRAPGGLWSDAPNDDGLILQIAAPAALYATRVRWVTNLNSGASTVYVYEDGDTSFDVLLFSDSATAPWGWDPAATTKVYLGRGDPYTRFDELKIEG